jgi:hypothetical protein
LGLKKTELLLESDSEAYSENKETKNPIFWARAPCSPVKLNQLVPETSCLHLQCRRVNQERNQHEASSAMSDDFHQTARHFVPEDRTLRNHRCGNLKSYKGDEIFDDEVQEEEYLEPQQSATQKKKRRKRTTKKKKKKKIERRRE